MSTSFNTLITNFAVTCKPWRPKNVLDHFSQKYGLFFVFKSKACPCLASLVRATEVSCPRNLGNDRTTQKYGREENVSKVNTFVFCRLLNFLGRLCFSFIIFFAVDSYSCFFFCRFVETWYGMISFEHLHLNRVFSRLTFLGDRYNLTENIISWLWKKTFTVIFFSLG